MNTQHIYSNKAHSVLRRISWNILEKYSIRTHEYCDPDPLYKALKLGFSSLRVDEIEKFLEDQKQKSKSSYTRLNFDRAIDLLK